jgi:threonine dehydratase
MTTTEAKAAHLPDRIAEAADRLSGHVTRTPLVVAAPLSERTGANIAIKAEHRQRTGSFKLRGATNKVMALPEAEAAAGIVTASSGNHGIGVATAAAARGIPCTVYLPTGAAGPKVAAIKRLGAEVVTVDDTDAIEAERQARAAADGGPTTYVSPYNDLDVVAGQGTIGLEILADLDQIGWDGVDAVVASVGGGGLLSGIAGWVSQHSPDTVIVGASPANDPAMAASVAEGRIIEPPADPTFSDGTAGAVEAGAVTFPLCQDLVDQWSLIDEMAIATAVRAMIDDQHELVEGAAGVALAAAERWAADNPGSRIVVVTCGANVSSQTLASMLAMAP